MIGGKLRLYAPKRSLIRASHSAPTPGRGRKVPPSTFPIPKTELGADGDEIDREIPVLKARSVFNVAQVGCALSVFFYGGNEPYRMEMDGQMGEGGVTCIWMEMDGILGDGL